MKTVIFGGKQIKVVTDIKEVQNLMADVCDVFKRFGSIGDMLNFLVGRYQVNSYGRITQMLSYDNCGDFINKIPCGQYIEQDSCFTANIYKDFNQQEINEIAKEFYDSEPGWDMMLITDISDETNKLYFMQCESD